MFCPNCGTQNESAASPCKKCGFKLSGVSAPKFKGTMMLNSEQSVQELIEEHKRKRAEGGAAGEEEAKPEASAEGQTPPVSPVSPRPSGAPLSGLPGAPKSVLQPPRAAATRRRMGGTMLGVAPQVGGIMPPATPPTPAPPPPAPAPELAPTPQPPVGATSEAAAPAERFPAVPVHASPARPDPLAGTVAMPMVTPAAPITGGTQPLAMPPEPAPHGAPAPAVAAPVDPWAREPDVAAPRGTAQKMPELAPLPSDSSFAPPPRRIRPLEVFLIVATCGLYGLFLLVRQRKTPE